MLSEKHDLNFITAILSENPLIHRPDILFGKLGDGLDYCIFNIDSIRNHFYLNLVVNVGSIHEEDDEVGIANFVQQLVLSDLNDKLSKIRSEHLVNIISSTDFHCTIYNVSNEIDTAQLSESDSRATFFEALEIFINSIYKFQEKVISFSNEFEEKIRYIKKHIYETIEDSKYSLANLIEREIFSAFHKDTLLPRRWPIGEKEIIQKLTISSLLKFMNKWYLPENMCLFIIGDIPVSNELLLTHLSSLVAGINSKNKNYDISLKNIYETSSFYNIFCSNSRIGYRNIIEKVNSNPFLDLVSQREFIFEHESIDQISISIGAKLPICPLLDEGEIFTNAIDTIISNIIHQNFSEYLENNNLKNFVSISWDFYNSSRENCGWNTFSIVTNENYWRQILNFCIKQIQSICNSTMKKEDLDKMISSTISDYRIAAEEEFREDPKIILDGLVDDWLCGNIPLSKKQEYQLFSKVIDHITPEIVRSRCNSLFCHIINYFDVQKCKNSKVSSIGKIFISKPTREMESEYVSNQENSNINSKKSNETSNSKFLVTLLEEFEFSIENSKECSISELKTQHQNIDETFEIKNKISEQNEFGLWDVFKASAYISFEKLFETMRTNFYMIIGEKSEEIDIKNLKGNYSVKELDLLVEKISLKSNSCNNSGIDIKESDSDEICDLGSFE